MPYTCTKCNKTYKTRSEVFQYFGKCEDFLLKCDPIVSVESKVNIANTDSSFNERMPVTEREKIFLPSHLSIKLIYTEYLQWRVENGYENSVGYDTFFKTKGYKFKEPFIDTCKTCDEFNVFKRQATNKADRDVINDNLNIHVLEAQGGYDRKHEDKENAKSSDYQRVLVFDLQQILPVPYLTTNIAYYKRLLTMYNLTIRDCSQGNESSDCCMWSELQGGRGSDQIASCILKKLLQLPTNIQQVITYSDTCGGQNRNINMAVMFMYALAKNNNLEVIDQKFLLPGHTRLECDSDHGMPALKEQRKDSDHQDLQRMVERSLELWFLVIGVNL